MPPAEVVGFGEHWLAAHARAYRWPVWNGAELLLGWIGDDSFADFTNWLIAQGQTTYEQVVANPDTLADLVQSRTDALSPTAEKLGEIVDTAYESALVQLGLSSNPSDDGRAEPAGKAIDLHDEDAVRTHFPRIAELRKTLRTTPRSTTGAAQAAASCTGRTGATPPGRPPATPTPRTRRTCTSFSMRTPK